MQLPVGWYPACRAWHRLVQGMVLRRSQRWPALVHLLSLVVPEPFLARLEAPDQRVPGRLRVRGRVLRWRGVAAADVPASGTAAEVDPPAADFITLHAASPAGRNGRVNA